MILFLNFKIMICSKIKHPTKKDAITALNYIKKYEKKRQYRKECRAYYCDDCMAWHLTSKENFSEEPT